MDVIPNPDRLLHWAQVIGTWVSGNVLVLGNFLQATIVVAAYLAARFAAPKIQARLERRIAVPASAIERYLDPVIRAMLPLTLPILWLAIQLFSLLAAQNAEWPHHLLKGAVSLLAAWIIIRLASGFIRDPGWSRIVAVTAWSLAALNLLDLLDPTLAVLDRMAVTVGNVRISLLGTIKAVAILAGLLWLAGAVSRLLERRIFALPNLTPSVQVLFGKLVKMLLIVLAFVITLQSIGIDLTALTVFSGALGLGIGFGLQKVASNLISGIILLLDRSVKPGDVIAIGDTFGWINSLGARYVSVITRDGVEHLIPNEELISERVINWSYSSDLVRLKLPIGISYGSDPRRAMALAVEAAGKADRVIADPAPVCRLMKFGGDAVELELRVWIRDPQNGVANVTSDVLLGVWDLYHANGIEFPFAQRDLHLKSSVPLDVRVAKPGAKPGTGD